VADHWSAEHLLRAVAPGRVNLIGEHTDYAGGRVLPVPIDRYVVVAGEVSPRVELESERFPSDDGWRRRVAAVAQELGALGRPPVGLSGTIGGDLPAGAGLGSSGALGVAVARALCRVADFDLPALDLVLACRRAEERATGVPCGILDQAASALGRAGHALYLDCGALEYRQVALPPGIAILVVDSGVRRRVADTPYAERRRELEAGHPRRVRHVETENQRVHDAVEALERDDRLALGRLFEASQRSLRDDFEVSTRDLDLAVERALAAGAFAARLTGAGFGGSVLALVDVEQTDAAASALASSYRVYRVGLA
jgi:galactokinase